MWALIALFLGCGGADPAETGAVGDGERSGCDPMDPALCALPYPSSYFQVAANTESGVQNAYTATALPINRDGVVLEPDLLNRYDGVSTFTPMLTYLPGATGAGLIRWDDPEAYLADDARTVVLDTVTGERVPHFAEIDATADSDGERLLLLHPLVPLEHARRYVVAVRGVVDAGGAAIEASPAFTAVRDDGAAPGVSEADLRRAYYADHIFAPLEAAGVGRGDLQIAWDFTTSSLGSSLGRALAVRDDALARTGDLGPTTYVIDTVEDSDCADPAQTIARTLTGRVTVPRYTRSDAPGLDARLVDGVDGRPTYQGDTESSFLLRIPCSLAQDPGDGGMVLQYGHGLLGSYDEARGDYLAAMANENRWVLLAQDWKGMSDQDAGYVTLMLATDLSDFEIIPDRGIQGLSELILGLRFVRNTLAADPLVQYGGRSVIDPTRAGYYGNSQGGILGAAYLALSPDLERGVLGVPGAPYSLLLSRSADFDPFFLLFDQKYLDDRDRALLLAIIQTAWDPAEPAGYARHLTADPLPGSPAKTVLLQAALGDAQVTTIGAEVMARSFGANTVAPETQPVFGVPEREAPFVGSALVEWRYTDVAPIPLENVPPDTSGDTHECPRREPAAQAQLAHFLEVGEVIQTCTGPCEGVQAETCP